MNPSQLPLEDIIQPAAIGIWPPAIGWWILAAILLMSLTFLCIYLNRVWQARKVRLQAYELLDAAKQKYKTEGNASNYCRDINEALKRYWHHYNKDSQILSCTGSDWVKLLNQQHKSDIFHAKISDALAHGPYRKIGKLNLEVIDKAARKWIGSVTAHQLRKANV